MVKAYFKDSEHNITVPGLTQWDYGQVLMIHGLEAAGKVEVHYAECRQRKEAIIDVPKSQDGILSSRVPNKLLESGEDLCAYIYIADEDSGETVRTIILPVKRRQKPGDYDAPAEKNLLRQLMERVNGKADSIELDESGGYLQLTSEGRPVGERIRLTVAAGREIELKNSGTVIQWRNTDSNEWTDLILLDDIRGKEGIAPEFEVRDGHLWAVYPES